MEPSLPDDDFFHEFQTRHASPSFKLKLSLYLGRRCWRPACQASELVQLRVEDVGLAERVVTIRRGKGSKRREVPIRRELTQLLRLPIGSQRTGPLFPSRERGTRPMPYVMTR
jgi:integrase